MNDVTLKYLRHQIRFHGFGDSGPLFNELEKALEEGKKEFELSTMQFFDEDCAAEATLYFRRPDSVEMYYFNKYHVELRYIDDPESNMGQTFFIGQSGKGFTFKEAFNLMEGRVVYRKNISGPYSDYAAWSQLDFDNKDGNGNYKFKRFYDSYKYDLELALRNYDIIGLDKEEIRENLLRSLEKGNLHQVLIQTKNKKMQKQFIQADPQNKLVILHAQATRAEIRQAIKERKKQVEIANSAPDKPEIKPLPSGPEINLPRPGLTSPVPDPQRDIFDPEEEEEDGPVHVAPPTTRRKRSIK